MCSTSIAVALSVTRLSELTSSRSCWALKLSDNRLPSIDIARIYQFLHLAIRMQSENYQKLLFVFVLTSQGIKLLFPSKV